MTDTKEPTIYTVEVIEVHHIRKRYAVVVQDLERGERINRMLASESFTGSVFGQPVEE